MPRPATDRVHRARKRLLARIDGGAYGAGDRFLSNRAAARLLGVSYQTADRLMRRLVAEGRLVRRRGSGTFLPGTPSMFMGALLVVHVRARRRGSFGARLLLELVGGLRAAGVDLKVRFVQPGMLARPLPRDRYPVIWEAPAVVDLALREHGRALLINARPVAGMAALQIDSVSVDDYTGGAVAAELLVRAAGAPPPPGLVTTLPPPPTASLRLAILAGPANDPRSEARVAGFTAVAPARVIRSPDWFVDGGMMRAAEVVRAGTDGVFCCNDRLAEAVHQWCRTSGRPPPRLVGFDDAPVAADLELTTIAIPWESLGRAVVDMVRTRLRGDVTVAQHLTLPTTPVIRRSLLRVRPPTPRGKPMS